MNQTVTHDFATIFHDSQTNIEQWFEAQWQATPPTFYSSIDLRNAGYKIAPVDTNLFPAGFNNLDTDCQQKTTMAIKEIINARNANIKNILLIPENHTRNIMYWENIASLVKLIESAGYTIKIGSLLPLPSAKTITLPSGQAITLHPISKQDNQLVIENYLAELILSNNDFAEGIPDILHGIKQPIAPPTSLGWSKRLKSAHFQHYHNVAHEFATELDIDPWLLEPLFQYCGDIDFMTNTGEECLIKHSTTLLQGIKQKYAEYQVKQQPFIMIKADAGTYGMAVMKIQDPEEIHSLNRKARMKMAKGKGGISVTKAIVQEGIYSIDQQHGSVAEPVIYLIGKHAVGGFYRSHPEKAHDESLNAPGMTFKPMPCVLKKHYHYNVVARLAALAAAREKQEVMA